MNVPESLSAPNWLQWVRDAVLAVDEDGGVLWANPGAELLLGKSEEDLCRGNLRDVFAEREMADRLLEDLRSSQEEEFACVVDLQGIQGRDLPMELTFYKDRSISYRILVVQPYVEEGGETDRVAVQALQLSNRLSSLQNQVHELSAELLDKTIQLSEEKNKTEAVLASMGEGLLVVDREGHLVQINEMACRILEIGSEEVLGKTLEDSPIGSKLPTIASLIQNRTAAGSPSEPGSSRLELQEKVIEFSLATIREREDEQASGGTVLNLRDVTRQAEVDRMKTELISIVSHELRSPLANITGYLDLVLSDTSASMPEEQKNFLQVAHKNSVKLARLVDDMLDLSRLESGKIEMNLSEVDAEYLINFAHLSFKNEAEAKNIEFTKSIEGKPRIHGDSDRLQQVLNNLVSNAIKYTPEEGTVRLECAPEGSQVMISVSDTGIGILPEDQVRLFQRFFRVRSSETRKIRGTGLGLSIAKTIIDAHGGRLTVSSEYGKGSTFTVSLPTVES